MWFIWQVLIFWNHSILTSLPISSINSHSIYVNKQLFNSWSPFFLRNLFLTIFIHDKALSTLAVARDIVYVSFISLYISRFMLSFFFSIISPVTRVILFTDGNSTFNPIFIICVANRFWSITRLFNSWSCCMYNWIKQLNTVMMQVCDFSIILTWSPMGIKSFIHVWNINVIFSSWFGSLAPASHIFSSSRVSVSSAPSCLVIAVP